MSWYDTIENKLESYNDTDYEISIDDIDENSITFSVYDSEVVSEVLDVIEKTLQFINRKQLINLLEITYHPSKNGSQECFNLFYRINIGKDEKTEDEIYRESKEDREDRLYHEAKEDF